MLVKMRLLLPILWCSFLIVAAAAKDCPKIICNCSEPIPQCLARNSSDLLRIKRAGFHKMSLDLDSSIKISQLEHVKLLPKLKTLYLLSRVDKGVALKLVNMSASLRFLFVPSNGNYSKDFIHRIFRESNISIIQTRDQIGPVSSYERIRNPKMTCNNSCSLIGASNVQSQSNTSELCICVKQTFSRKLHTPEPFTNSTGNATNITRALRPQFPKPKRYFDSMRFSIILGSFSLLALLVNFVILAKMCQCQGQSVSKIFGMSTMLFNILLAEYGIALAIYLTQEDGTWNKSFCQGMTAIKLFSMMAVIFALLCMTFQSSINPPDDNYNKQDVRFKAIVYILEGFVLSGMICILAWTKFDNWGYLCAIYRPVKAAEKIIVGIEYCFHCLLFVLAIRFPYKTLRRKEPVERFIKMKYVVEREHPIFVMVVTTFMLWSVPFFVTIPAFGVGNQYITPLIRNCALMAAAIVLPFLFVIRNTWVCCSRHTACGVNDPRICQCKGHGSDLCYACEIQHKDMISNCEFHSFGDRRKSLSLDDLKYVLNVYKKSSLCSMKIKKKKLISRSFPVLNMDTIEEAEVEDITDIDQLFLGKATNFELSVDSPKKALLSRENTTSMPNLTSPAKMPAVGKKRVLQAKLSLSPRKSALFSPVKKSLEKKRAASFDHRTRDLNVDSSSSDRSTTSSPIKSDSETNSLLNIQKKSAKKSRKKSKISKSKESIKSAKSKDSIKSAKSKDSLKSTKSKDSIKSKDGSKSTPKNKLEVDAVNTDSSGPASPNRVSRIPSFIPLADAASGSSDSLQRKKSTSSAKNSPAKSKLVKSKSLLSKRSTKSKDEEEAELLGEDSDRVPSRGPTFFLVGEEDDMEEGEVQQPLISKEKKAGRSLKKQKRSGQKSKEGTPIHEVDGAHGSRNSLEWDPSYSLSDSSCPSPVDEFSPPEPAPPPSNFALERVKEMGVRQPDSPHVSIGRGSSYSMDWDPTAIQIRQSLVSPCEWEPYSVDETRSGITSPEDLTSSKVMVKTTDSSNNKTEDDSYHGTTAPLATAET